MSNYDQAYEHLLSQNLTIHELNSFVEENSRSLKVHIDKVLEQFSSRFPGLDYKCLELGCGGGGISSYMASRGFRATGLDISREAIKLALRLKDALSLDTRFLVFDVCQDTELTEKFDLIIDGHLLHCLTEAQSRNNYLKFVKNNLAPNGLFLGECMSFHKDLKFPIEYNFAEDDILYHHDQPIRLLRDPLALEAELLAADLKIEYFYCHSELGFQVYTEYPDFPGEYLPKTIRFAASA